MQPIGLNCEPEQGFSFDGNKVGYMGYLLDLKIGDTEFKGKVTYEGPTKTKALGVLRGIHWEGKAQDPITISAYVHQLVAETVNQMLDNPTKLAGASVSFSFKGMKHGVDKDGKGRYFDHFWSDDKLQGMLADSNGTLQIQTYTGFGDRYRNVYYPLTFIVIPSPSKTQALHVARDSEQGKQSGPWGSETST